MKMRERPKNSFNLLGKGIFVGQQTKPRFHIQGEGRALSCFTGFKKRDEKKRLNHSIKKGFSDRTKKKKSAKREKELDSQQKGEFGKEN